MDPWRAAPKKRALAPRQGSPKKRGRPSKRQKVEGEAPFEVMFPGKTVRLVKRCLFDGESFDEARRKAILPEGATHFVRIRMRHSGGMNCIEAAAVCVS